MVIRVGIVGTGYAARIRVEALVADERSHPVAVAGRDPARTRAFAERHNLHAAASWQALVQTSAVDLIVVATVSALHGEVVEAALLAGKHVVVEYPLSLSYVQAEQLAVLAAQRDLLLHVEHIELLGGLHLAMRSHLPAIGNVSYVNYRTLTPKRPAPKKWTYQPELFGFPFCGALSRVHRLTNLFGQVARVDCVTRAISCEEDVAYFKSLLSFARLLFKSGAIAELTYGKGEALWVRCKDIEVQGSAGALVFEGNEGRLITDDGVKAITAEPRKGLLAQDTQSVLDYLNEGKPLYVSVSESLYALKVGDALRRASESGQSVCLD